MCRGFSKLVCAVVICVVAVSCAAAQTTENPQDSNYTVYVFVFWEK